jgi:transcriptional regulator with PAS, ATPase and Fis domain
MTIKFVQETEEMVVEAHHVPMTVQVVGHPAGEQTRLTSLRVSRAEAELRAISRALDCAGWNRRRAAQLLRISYRGLLYKIRQYNITVASRGPVKQDRGIGEER